MNIVACFVVRNVILRDVYEFDFCESVLVLYVNEERCRKYTQNIANSTNNGRFLDMAPNEN